MNGHLVHAPSGHGKEGGGSAVLPATMAGLKSELATDCEEQAPEASAQPGACGLVFCTADPPVPSIVLARCGDFVITS